MGKKSTITLFAVMTMLASSFCFGMVIETKKGTWPDSWPKELEPFRKQATTLEMATGIQENVYEIRFENREEFEKLWPIILKLKDKKAPLRLRSIERPIKGGSLFNSEKPVVRIFSHVYPAWPSGRPGGRKLRPAPPWPDSIKSPTGELPEYVAKSEDGNAWIPVEKEKPRPWDFIWSPVEEERPRGFMYRARTEIELVVDGIIIDLNRILLPPDTPIIDRRFEERQQDITSHSSRTLHRKTCALRKPLVRDFINDMTLILGRATWHTAPAVADIDNDGDMELIVCEEDGNVNVWHHDGTPAKGWPQSAQGRICSPPALGDLDGNGKLEIVVNGTHVWRWNGAMMEGWPADNSTGSCFSPPCLSDLDRDGRLEIINGSALDHRVYARNYRGELLEGWPQPTGGQVRATPSVGDVDGDGQPEIVVGSWDFNLYVWNADGSLVSGWPRRFGKRIEQQATLADMDGDAQLDILVGSDRLYVLDGEGNPVLGWEEGRRWNAYSTPSVADIDGDGEVEIFGAGYGWYNHDGSTISTPGMRAASYSDGAIAGDIDGDGRIEVIWTTRREGTHAYRVDGSSPLGWPKEQGGGDGSCTLADLDGDGDVEVILATRGNRAYVWDCPGKFGSETAVWPVHCANNQRTGVADEIEFPQLDSADEYELTTVRQALTQADYQRAIREFERIVRTSEIGRRRLEAQLSIARIYNFRLRQYEDAFNTYTAILLPPSDDERISDAFTELCDVYAMRMENKEQFEDQFEQAVKTYEDLVERKQIDEPASLGRMRCLLAYGLRLAGDERSLEMYKSVSRDFTNTSWARLAAKVVRFGTVDYFVNLDFRKGVEYTVEGKDLMPGDTVRQRTSWNLVVSPQSPYKAPFPCTTVIIASGPVSAETRPEPKVVTVSQGTTKLIWDEKLRTTDFGTHGIDSHAFSIDDTVRNEDVEIRRESERLDDTHRKVTISITAPYKVSLRAAVFRSEFSIEDEGIDPKCNSKTSDIIVFGSSRPDEMYDCSDGQDFTFVMKVPPSCGACYPDTHVTVGSGREIERDVLTNIKKYTGTAEGYSFEISSTEHFDVKGVERSFWRTYHLKLITE